jgi:uncharacterized membrane protein YuzA (DUF378 family)
MKKQSKFESRVETVAYIIIGITLVLGICSYFDMECSLMEYIAGGIAVAALALCYRNIG